MNKEIIEVYTDGACSGNPGPGGAGVVLIFKDEKLVIGKKSKSLTTNNEQELTAILIALRELSRRLDKYSDSQITVNLKSDSEYSIKCITEWYNGYIRRGWRTAAGKPVKNKELIQKIKNKEELLKNLYDININYIHVRGHCGIKGNELADATAVRAMNEGDICVHKSK